MRIFLGVLALGLAYLLLWPVPVEPVPDDPPKGPGFTGEFEENTALEGAQKVVLPNGAIGPEDLAVMPDGTVYTTDLDGNLYRIDGDQPEFVEALGGRPLGLKAGPDGALYIADSFRGIMRWSGPGALETTVSEIDG